MNSQSLLVLNSEPGQDRQVSLRSPFACGWNFFLVPSLHQSCTSSRALASAGMRVFCFMLISGLCYFLRI